MGYSAGVETTCIETNNFGQPVCIKFEKTVVITSNTINGVQRNLVIKDYDNPQSMQEQFVAFSLANPVSSISQIGVTCDNIDHTDNAAFIAYNTWTNNGNASVKETGATHNIFKADDSDNYKIYRNIKNILIGRKNEKATTTIRYEYYCDIISTPFPEQNIVDGSTHADDPGIPQAQDGAKFIAWYYDYTIYLA